MPKRRRFSRGRSRKRARRTVKSRVPRSIRRTKPYFVKRTVLAQTTVVPKKDTSTGADPKLFNPLNNAWFQLSHVPNPSEFTNFWALYKINGIRLKFIPNIDTNIAQFLPSGSTGVPPPGNVVQYTWYDPTRDPASTPQLDDIEQYQNLSTRVLQRRSFSIFFKPKIIDRVTESPGSPETAGAPMFRQKKAGWLSTSNPSVQHTGPRVAWSRVDNQDWPDAGDNLFSYRVFITYYLSFKIVK